MGEKRLLSGFNVLKPEFRFIMERSNLDVIVGSKCILSVDSQYIPSKGVTFVSSKASVVRIKNALYITPSESGVFEIQMKIDSKKLQTRDITKIAELKAFQYNYLHK